MYKNNDEVFDWEIKRILDDGIYTDYADIPYSKRNKY